MSGRHKKGIKIKVHRLLTTVINKASHSSHLSSFNLPKEKSKYQFSRDWLGFRTVIGVVVKRKSQ
jgi:hypothetical protein